MAIPLGSPITAHSNFFAKSVIIPEPGLAQENIRAYINYTLNTNTPTSYFAYLDLYGGACSQANAVRIETFAAFSHRNRSWVAQHYGWADIDANFPDQGVDYNNGLNNALASGVGTSYTSHEGYIGPKLAEEEAHSQYYGPIVYSKVKSIKTKVDTYDLFSSSFSI
ncbi:putative FAD-binding PCMH-type domain-containing protein [Seiridium unicorne]|uniref:FAD-binding PCMH-type domain-containing protein n=1 Tax=Seiridium unicorne TaxID=138068 RepID=A0ABR2VDZ5_9PEZI